MLSVTLLVDGSPVISFCLPPGINPRIGRDPAVNEIVLHDPRVSRSHAQIHSVEGVPDSWQLIDFGSKKGTFLNGQRVDGTTPLAVNDILELGPYILLVEFGSAVESSQPAVLPAERTQRMVLERCPRCQALALDFETCLRCGMPLAR